MPKSFRRCGVEVFSDSVKSRFFPNEPRDGEDEVTAMGDKEPEPIAKAPARAVSELGLRIRLYQPEDSLGTIGFCYTDIVGHHGSYLEFLKGYVSVEILALAIPVVLLPEAKFRELVSYLAFRVMSSSSMFICPGFYYYFR
ncbi:hypothetical protein HAX54_032523 [Datura stramonium]|uniref:Uncharacterized protein n=1 Tax=Datura stramonium TaxID=4076 RepID=A0ABS8VCX4_DATST|nr:hypothetical protein [Datura stramonium]